MRITNASAYKSFDIAGLEQSRLDIQARGRTSRLPWRGQFSPELIEYFIDEICPDAGTICDPFCGSGTVLFEALRKGKSSLGCEVNPAAWHLAKLSEIASVTAKERTRLATHISRVHSELQSSAFFGAKTNFADKLVDSIQSTDDMRLRNLFAAVLLIGMGNGTTLSIDRVARACRVVTDALSELEGDAQEDARCLLNDARHIPTEDESVDAIITSPPYINVFNYHQNYRSAVELLGWQPLQAAKSEIGANRKHRMNRFLTVVQYCLDLSSALREMSRIMRPRAPLIIVIGRTSSVLGAAFGNGDLLTRLIRASKAFGDVRSAERVFVNRYGERIYEDILITNRTAHRAGDQEDARAAGTSALKDALHKVPEKNRADLESAILSSASVSPSPLLKIETPSIFRF
jgi:hypothetical protein